MKGTEIAALPGMDLWPVIFEIGANNGSNTVDFLDSIPRLTIVAFEPDRRAFGKLKATTDKRLDNDPLLAAYIENIALSNIDGETDFYVSSGKWPGTENSPDEWDMSSSIRKPTGHKEQYPWCKFDSVVKVKSMRLDTYCKTKGKDLVPVDFVWMDVQGAELDVIEGGNDTFENSVHYLYTEYSNIELYEGQPTRNQILKALPGYRVVQDFGNDILLENTNWKK